MKKLRMAALLLALMIPQNAGAEGKMKLAYDVYMGGIKGLTADIVIEESKDGSFQITTFGKTVGMIDAMYPFRGTYQTQGKITDGVIRITKSSSRRQVGKKVRETILFYDDLGRNIERISRSNGAESRYVNGDDIKNLSKGALDYNTVFFKVLKALEKEDCTFDTAVWSGKKKTNLFFRTEEPAIVKKARMSPFQGLSYTCAFTVEGSGDASEDTWFWKTSGDGKMEPVPVKSWYQKPSDMPFPVLVKAQHTIDMGVLIVYLTEAQKL